MLYVDGAVMTYGPPGPYGVRLNRKGRFSNEKARIHGNVGVPESVWRSSDSAACRKFFSDSPDDGAAYGMPTSYSGYGGFGLGGGVEEGFVEFL